MSSLDLDKRKIFSILERKAKELNLSVKDKPRKIYIQLSRDLHKNEVPLLQNQNLLDDVFLFVEEQTNRRFVYCVGVESRVVDTYQENEYKNGKLVNTSDIDINDDVYTFIFNPAVESINPKDFIDRTELFYITFDRDTFYFNGQPLDLGKTANYYKAFCILYSLIPDGGEALFADLIKETRRSLRPYKNKEDSEIVKYLQDNLTGKKNGFQRKANLPDILDNGKTLLENIRTRGIQFNNKK